MTIKGNLVVGFSALNNGAKVQGGDGGAAMVIDGEVNATSDVNAGNKAEPQVSGTANTSGSMTTKPFCAKA